MNEDVTIEFREVPGEPSAVEVILRHEDGVTLAKIVQAVALVHAAGSICPTVTAWPPIPGLNA